MIIFGVLVLILIVVFIFILANSFTSDDEVYRELSPSGDFEIIVVEGNGGAISSFWYNVYIVKRGSSINLFSSNVAYYYGALRNDCAYGINVGWESENIVLIEYYSSEISELETSIIIDDKKIKIVSNNNVVDEFAPPGGMLYNLENESSAEQRRALYCK